ncbi:MAG: polysaccharide deacetylase family protein [Planctomycetes bacterium]|nr:polysaccharide deacetylase family protein [Planctomycetota bacterium]MBL7037244.1 polysaccharide deacetylase family protein [Pirellulaceae bacterium]
MTQTRMGLWWLMVVCGLPPLAAEETKPLKEGTQYLLGIEPLRSPEETLRGLVVRPGFRVELVAAEPMVTDPVDIAFGPDGKLWVVEMADYPLGMDGRGKPGGRVRYLEDTDGDGKYDKSTIFLENVNYPNGIMAWRDGVLVTAAPEVFYAEDTNGDGMADVRRVLFAGFGEGNQQHRVNHPRWGLDNWVYLANGDGGAGAGGLIHSVKTGEHIDIRGRDLRVRPDEGRLDVVTGQAQFGRCRDDWGNWFGCNNRNPGWHYALVDHYIRRNPYVAAPPGRINLSPDAEPIASGRVISYRRVGYQVPEKGATKGRFTSVGGMTVYRDELLGPGLCGDVFTSDSAFNVVHHIDVAPEGVTFLGGRAPNEEQTEFLASDDPWLRTCGLRTGPDGALYVVGMYRLSIEHPEWIEDEVEDILDLRLGNDRGRIYRIVPADKELRPILRLDRLDTAGLVAALDSPNGPQRDLAQQMLIWRGDQAAVGPLEAMVTRSQRALARLHAICTLDGLGALRPEVLLNALADEHPGVRRQAIRLAEAFLKSDPAISGALLKLVDDPDPQVQMQLAYSLGEWDDARAGRALGRLALRHVDDPYLTAAAMSSAPGHLEAMLTAIQEAPERTPARDEFIIRLTQLQKDIREYPDLATELEAKRRAPVDRGTEGALSIEASPERRAALAKFRPVLDMEGDPERGREVFVEATCSTCHRIGGLGQKIGPDIETLLDRSPEILFAAVVDPNRSVKARYVQYTAVTAKGLAITGVLREETSNSITLADPNGKRHVILRKDLEQLVSNRRSHMPEGLEGKLTLEQMADLFAFVGQRRGARPRQVPGNHPALVTAELDGSLHLLPRNCEIYGGRITVRTTHMVWFHESADDHVAWTVDVPSSGRYEVWFEWAQIDQYADNPFAIEVKGSAERLTGKLPSTGGWENYRCEKFGTLQLESGRRRIILRADGPVKTELSDLRAVRLVPVTDAQWTRVKTPAEAHARALADKANQAGGTVVGPSADKSLCLSAEAGTPSGGGLDFFPESKSYGPFAGTWPRVVWTVEVPAPVTFEVWLEWSAKQEWAGKRFIVEAGEKRFVSAIPESDGEDQWAKKRFGTLRLKAGRQRILFRPEEAIAEGLCYLREIRLVPSEAKTVLPTPDRLVVLTFDDGTKTDVTFVAPLLKEYGFGATFFISEGKGFPDDKQTYMTWEEVRKLHEWGFEIGNHTRHHRDASRQSAEEFRADVEYIETRCQQHGIPRPRSFCYPGYLHGPTAVRVLQEKDYLFARRGSLPEIPYAEEGTIGFAYDPKIGHPLLIPSAANAGPKCGLDELIRAAQMATDGKIAVLTFHGVPDPRAPYVSMDPKDFRKFLDYLRDQRYKVIALRDLAEYIEPARPRQRAELKPLPLSYRNDGFSLYYATKPPMTRAILEKRFIDPLADSSVKTLVWGIGPGGGGVLTFNTKVGEIYGDHLSEAEWKVCRPQDRWVNQNVHALIEEAGCPLHIVAQRAHQLGMKAYGRFPMQRGYGPKTLDRFMGVVFTGQFSRKHPEYWIPGTSFYLDFKHKGVRDFKLAIIREAVEAGLDGIFMDFCTKPGPFFTHPDCQIMTQFVRDCRKMLDEIETRQKRELDIMVRVPCRGAKELGLDWETWMREQLIDCLVPAFAQTGPGKMGYQFFLPADRFVAIGKETGCKVYGFIWHDLGIVSHDPAPDGKIRYAQLMNREMFTAQALSHHQSGVDGIHLAWGWGDEWAKRSWANDLSDPDKLKFADKHYMVDVGAHIPIDFALPSEAPFTAEAGIPLRIADNVPEAQAQGYRVTATLVFHSRGVKEGESVSVYVNGQGPVTVSGGSAEEAAKQEPIRWKMKSGGSLLHAGSWIFEPDWWKRGEHRVAIEAAWLRPGNNTIKFVYFRDSEQVEPKYWISFIDLLLNYDDQPMIIQ